MSSPTPLLHLFTLLIALTTATPHQAKRLPQYDLTNVTIQDVCGSGASDCGNGYCCSAGSECISPSSPSNEYQYVVGHATPFRRPSNLPTDSPNPRCADLLYPTLTIPAIAYSSFESILALSSVLDFDPLTSLGLTLSTVGPTTPSTFTGFKTYSDNTLPSTTWQTASLDTESVAGGSRTSTGGAVKTAAAAVGVGMGMGVGMLVEVGEMILGG